MAERVVLYCLRPITIVGGKGSNPPPQFSKSVNPLFLKKSTENGVDVVNVGVGVMATGRSKGKISLRSYLIFFSNGMFGGSLK